MKVYLVNGLVRYNTENEKQGNVFEATALISNIPDNIVHTPALYEKEAKALLHKAVVDFFVTDPALIEVSIQPTMSMI